MRETFKYALWILAFKYKESLENLQLNQVVFAPNIATCWK